MGQLTNNAEGGSDGTTVTTGNSGGVSGNAFNTVTIGSGAALTYSNTKAAHGSLAYHLTTGATAANCLLMYTTSVPSSPSTAWVRFCFMQTTLSATRFRLFKFIDAAGAAIAASIDIQNGFIQGRNTSDAQVCVTTNAITAGRWYRLEAKCVANTTTGQVEVKLFDSIDSPTPLETQTSAATNTSTNTHNMQFGQSFSASNYDVWMDDLAWSDVGYIGPVTSQSGFFGLM